MARGEAWLKAQLAKALQWDEFVVEGVVDVISKAKSADEVQEIVHVSRHKESSDVRAVIIPVACPATTALLSSFLATYRLPRLLYPRCVHTMSHRTSWRTTQQQ